MNDKRSKKYFWLCFPYILMVKHIMPNLFF